nr:MAG TPA: hypothetical protein [Caudoviricetes sp.]
MVYSIKEHTYSPSSSFSSCTPVKVHMCAYLAPSVSMVLFSYL